MSKKHSLGVTLTSLVITIIVMTIITGVTIMTLDGDDGIIKRTSNSVKNYERADEKEILGESYAAVYLTSELKDEDITTQWLEDELYSNNKDTRVRAYPDNPNKYSVTFRETSNEYSINVETGEIEYLGTYKGGFEDIDFKTQDIIIASTPTMWVHGDVDTTMTLSDKIKDKMENYTLQWRRTGTDVWQEYTGTITSTKNEMIYARIYNKIDGFIETTGSLGIANIDKVDPTVAFGKNGGNYVVDTEKGKATVKTTVTVTDAQIPNAVGIMADASGVYAPHLKYVWAEKGITPTSGWAAFTNGQELVKTDCEYGKTYVLWVQFNDWARANSRTGILITNTADFIIGTETQTNITLAATWDANASNTAKVDITGEYTGSTLQYQVDPQKVEDLIDDKKWISGDTVTVNGGLKDETDKRKVYARLYDGINSHYASIQVKDETAPILANVTPNVVSSATPKAEEWRRSLTLTSKAVDNESLITHWDWAETPTTQKYGTVTANIERQDKTVIKGVSDTGNQTLTIEKNGTYYFSAKDGATRTSVKSKVIENIDPQKPNKPVFGTDGGNYVVDTAKAAATIKTTVTVTDPKVKDSAGNDVNGSGVNAETLKYAWSESTTAPSSGWTAFTNGAEITKTDCAYGKTYYLHVQYNDNAGVNSGEEVHTHCSNAFVIGTEAETKVTLAATWDLEASNTAKVDITGGYTGSTLQYQVNGISGEWISGNTVTVNGGLKDETDKRMVYARLYDGINSHYASIKIKDETAPTVTNITASTDGWAQSVSLKVAAEDTPALITHWDWASTPSTQRYGDVTRTIQGTSKSVPKGVSETGQLSTTVTTNGTHYFSVADGAGNKTVKSIDISKIDRTAPTLTLAATPGTNNFELAGTFSDNASGLSTIEWYYKRPQDSSWQNEETIYTEMYGTEAGVTSAGGRPKTKSISVSYGGSIQAYAIGYDVAGNSVTSNTVSFNTTQVTITYNPNGQGASVNPTTKSGYYNTETSHPTPTRPGHTFKGWDPVYEKYPSSNVTVNAIWADHTFSSSVTTQPTCTATGVRTYTCPCGASYTETVAAVGHSYTVQDTSSTYLKSAATCTEKAVYYYKCSRCTASSKGATNTTYESGNALGHNSVYGGESNAHTVCSRCSVITDPNHSYTSKVEVAATCTTKGKTKYICACGFGYSEENIAALGHSYTAQDTSSTYLKSAATCTTKAVYYYKCSRCTEKGTGTYESGNALGHNFTSQTVSATYLRSNATCTAAATYYYKCSRCTASSKDNTNTYYPSGNAAGHSWNAGTTVTAATCTTTGVLRKTCQRSGCGQTTDETIAALGHSYSTSFTTDTAATCTAAGSKSKHCTRSGCTAKTEVTAIAALGHAWPSSYSYATNNSVTNGERYKNCTRCSTRLETAYLVQTNKGTGISSVTASGYKASGASVSLSATASTGYGFSTWSTIDGGTTTSNPYTFTMPSKAVNLTATGADTTPPTIGVFTSEKADTHSVKLSFSASDSGSGMSSYRVYRDGTHIGSYTTTTATVASNFGVNSFTVYAYDVAGNSSSKSLAYNDFEVNSETDLIKLRDQVAAGTSVYKSAIVTQVADFTCTETWDKGIGTSATYPFSGKYDAGKTYDSNGNCTATYCITKLTISSSSTNNIGLFGYNTGTIQNLTLNGPQITGAEYVGAVSGYNKGGTISNCKTSTSDGNSIIIKGTNQVGGIIGESDGGTITGCTMVSASTAEVKGNSNVGGIVGRICYSVTTVSNCSNSCPVYGTGDSIGGIIGMSGTAKHTITGCANKGSVSATNSTYVGGVVGCVTSAACPDITLSDNSAAIKGAVKVGGIVGGYIYAGTSSTYGTISQCYNKGAITSTYSSTAMEGIGGIVGEMAAYNTIKYSYNIGAVTASSYAIGGIIGYASGANIKIQYCYNNAAISSNGSVFRGGIYGYYASTSPTVTTSYNNSSATPYSQGGTPGDKSYNTTSITASNLSTTYYQDKSGESNKPDLKNNPR